MTLPYEIVVLPFSENESRRFKRYPNGATKIATTEECAVWDHFQAKLSESSGEKAKKPAKVK